MKNYSVLILAGTFLAFAACNNETNTSTQAQIDSAANARTSAMEAQMKVKNDSLINEMARMKADSASKQDSLAKVAAFNAGKAAGQAASKPEVNTHTTTKHTTTHTDVRHNTPVNVNDRPGGNGASTNSKGQTINNNTPKNVNDRPGGN